MKKSFISPFLLTALLFLCIIPVSSVFSQDSNIRFDHITREQGLPSNSVSSLAQDRFGFLWFGTQGGLAKYDGRKMRHFEHEPFNENSLPHDLIQTMYLEKEKDILWLGTYQGLSRMDINTENFTNYSQNSEDPASISNDIVTAIIRDSRGNLWVGTLGGLNKLNEETGTFIHYMTSGKEGELSNDTIRALYTDGAGTLWVGSYGGLSRYDPEKDKFYNFVPEDDNPFSLTSPYVMSITQDSAGYLWLGVWDGGAVRFDINSGKFETYPLADGRVYAVNVDARDTVWAATWGGGLIRFIPSSGDEIVYTHDGTEDFSLSNDVVYSLLYDNSGILWIGTNGGGINKLDGRKKNYLAFSKNPDNPKGLSDGKVTAIMRDDRENLWIGTYNGGLNRYSEDEDNITHYKHNKDDDSSLSNDIIRVIYQDSLGNLWIGSNGGLDRYISDQEGFEHYYHDPEDLNSIADNIVCSLQEDNSGNFWIGTYNRGISVYNYTGETYRHYSYDSEDTGSLSNNLVYSLFLSGKGEMWAGTNKGLNRYIPETDSFVRYLHDAENQNSLAGDSVRVMYEDSKGRLWIGSMSGGLSLYRRDTDDFKNYTKKHGLPDNKIRGILEDRDGNLWVSTEYGLVIFDPIEETFRLIDDDDGVYNNEFQGGRWKDDDGKLFFGCTEGIFVFHDAQLLENNNLPQVHITDVRIFDTPAFTEKPYLYTGPLEISYKDNFLTFEFIALDFAAPEKNRYKYKLEGFDGSWIYAGEGNYARYTNLRPGRYTFRVQASNNDGLWNETGASLDIRVLPPWWRTWWAYILYFVLAAGLIFLLFELRVKRALQEKVHELSVAQEQLKVENDRAEAATQAKSDFLAVTSHELRTPLNTITAVAELINRTDSNPEIRENVSILKDVAQDMTQIVNDILDISKIEAGKINLNLIDFDLRDVIENTVKALRPSAAEKGLRFTLQVEENLPKYVTGDPLRVRQILVNIIGNAVKFTSQGGISIFCGKTDTGIVRISVEDTGIGIEKDKIETMFEPFEQGYSGITQDYGGSGLGLHICRSLSKLMGGSLRVSSEPGKGSIFTINIPFEAAAAPVRQPRRENAIPAGPPQGRSFNVLLVEDNKINSRVAAKFLIEWGHTVLTAFSGEAGLKVLDKEHCDIVLLDIGLPGMDGYEFAERIRSGKAGEKAVRLPIIALTGHSGDCISGVLKEKGFDECIVKPIDFGKLHEIFTQLNKELF